MRNWIWRLYLEPLFLRLSRELRLRESVFAQAAREHHEELLMAVNELSAKVDRLQALVQPVAPRLLAGQRPGVPDWEETQRRNLTQFEENNG